MSKYRIHDLLNEIAEAAQKTYKGQKRSELKDSDFLFPETRSFPIVTPQDVPDAISNFGRMKGQMSYESFLKKLYQMAKRKGSEFVAALPEASKKQLGLTSKADDMYGAPSIKELKDSETIMENEKEDEEKEDEEEKNEDENEEEDSEEASELEEYKEDFYEMSLGSIKSIAMHAQAILDAVNSGSVKDGLTESWLQGKIAITEDYMLTIHNFLMFGKTETDTEGSVTSQTLSSLWENIRKKKERMGKNYRPAKPGDKDRPNPESWKKAQE